ncbi:hypothetical protein CHARACLAT_011783 [Characodon lateralis]|uniref:Secreted protein n=1 Tax=Characodon lateralis TaxID=208331 RepID=A0ABU7F3E1_9TELE|nr:hypothetical protein [Characodon lateralis]
MIVQSCHGVFLLACGKTEAGVVHCQGTTGNQLPPSKKLDFTRPVGLVYVKETKTPPTWSIRVTFTCRESFTMKALD